jgi:cytochrome b561
MQLSSAIHWLLLAVVLFLIVATAGDIDTKEQMDRGVLWKQ